MKCPYCESEIPDGSQFCESCGSSLKIENPVAQEPEVKPVEETVVAHVEEVADASVAGVTSAPVIEATELVSTEQQPTKKKKRVWLIVLIAILAVLIGAIAVIAIFRPTSIITAISAWRVSSAKNFSTDYSVDFQCDALDLDTSVSVASEMETSPLAFHITTGSADNGSGGELYYVIDGDNAFIYIGSGDGWTKYTITNVKENSSELASYLGAENYVGIAQDILALSTRLERDTAKEAEYAKTYNDFVAAYSGTIKGSEISDLAASSLSSLGLGTVDGDSLDLGDIDVSIGISMTTGYPIVVQIDFAEFMGQFFSQLMSAFNPDADHDMTFEKCMMTLAFHDYNNSAVNIPDSVVSNAKDGGTIDASEIVNSMNSTSTTD